MKIYNLHFKWTISRGRDTYGYNICTLYVNGDKKGRCSGGGYDMQGTSFARWLAADFQAELQELFKDQLESLKNAKDGFGKYQEGKGAEETRYTSAKGFYGATLYVKPNGYFIVGLDGACGMSSIEDIAKAIGLKLKWNKESDKYKNDTWYTAIYEPIQSPVTSQE